MLIPEKNKKIETKFSGAINEKHAANTIKTTIQLLEEQEQRLALYRGQDFLGLPQKTIPRLDALLLGLRKLITITAGPNIGKTALTIQLGIDVIKNNNNACLVYVTLEMSQEDIVDRIRCHLTPITYKKLYFGSIKNGEGQGWFDTAELEDLDKSCEELKKLAPRILILSDENTPNLDAEEVIKQVNKLKAETKCEKVIVIIDYFQVFPIAKSIKLQSEMQMDDFRMGQMKKLRTELNGDPVIVISEIRKSSGNNKNWQTTSSADSKGSGRLAYTPDAIMLLNQITDEELAKIKNPQNANIDEGVKIREHFAEQGLSFVKLTIDKARDGMQRGDIILRYHFRENRFEEITEDKIRSQCPPTIKNNSEKNKKSDVTDWADKF